MESVVDQVNANSQKVPTLWAKGTYSAVLIDHGHKTDVHGDAHLMYSKPQELLFVGSADPLGEVFRMGCGIDRYWLSVKADTDTTWFGSFENLDHADPTAIPVRPDLIEAVLGLDETSRDFSRPPCPVMRFNNDQRAYMIVWSVKFPDRWVAQKEIWYDLDTKLPRLVHLFDPDGRIILSAYLSEHQAIPNDRSPNNATTRPASGPVDAPMMATNYHLFFPGSGSTLDLHLDDLRFQSMGHPNAKNFAFNPQQPGTSHVIDLDATAR